ncbi:transposase [Lysinibacillus louembei]|uniref:Transposase n=1 Tax=Lysinibacillus louembei TaxID=1470088 RepID=A0ABZ0RZE1_9BACI|nr:transposase [Lysinibacillus louembei]WPK12168.1 transposase [Lysinibacillus louembei]
MAKYSEEFKLKVVLEYLQGTLGYPLMAKKYQIGAESQVRRWVRAYKEFGRKGLSVKKKKAIYSVQFKVDVLHFIKQTGASYQETAIQFKLNNPSLIANWNDKFLKEGVEGLQEKAKGRPSMSKKPQATPTQKEMSREEQLERENELLRLEVAYLNKLKAFRENPDAFLEKHKQRLPLNSKKKNSD